ncbi:MAG: hypothetical protein FWG72_06210 [Oscillospiraceae bacterium]|nr:hypothetical protein [Oscillospiraceae bacterium]
MSKRKPRNPADYEVIHKETLPDGRLKIILRNGAVCHAAPLPGGDWMERKARELCNIQYGIMERIAREKAAAAAAQNAAT